MDDDDSSQGRSLRPRGSKKEYNLSKLSGTAVHTRLVYLGLSPNQSTVGRFTKTRLSTDQSEQNYGISYPSPVDDALDEVHESPAKQAGATDEENNLYSIPWWLFAPSLDSTYDIDIIAQLATEPQTEDHIPPGFFDELLAQNYDTDVDDELLTEEVQPNPTDHEEPTNLVQTDHRQPFSYPTKQTLIVKIPIPAVCPDSKKDRTLEVLYLSASSDQIIHTPKRDCCDKIIKVRIGWEGKEWELCEDILKSYSSVFHKCLSNSNSFESITRLVILEKKYAAAFDIFFKWVFTGILFDSATGAMGLALEFELLAPTYIFGNKYGMPLFCNDIVDVIMGRIVEEELLLDEMVITDLYNNTRQGAPIRRFLLDMIFFIPNELDPQELPGELVSELAARPRRFGRDMHITLDKFSKWRKCMYHAHPAT